MTEELIVKEIRERVGILRLNRPKALNALNRAMMFDLAHNLRSYDQDPAVGCILIAGDERAFAAGADIREMADATPQDMIDLQYIEQWDVFEQIRKPVIAAVSGWCLGGGCELALACDMIVASETAKFGQPEITLGIMTGAGASQRLARTVGKYVTMEMVLNNRHLSAHEARDLGLVNRITSTDSFMDEAFILAAEIASRSPGAVQAQKKAVNMAYETSLQQGMDAERRMLYLLFGTEDQKEGMQAFLEKRPPSWKGI